MVESQSLYEIKDSFGITQILTFNLFFNFFFFKKRVKTKPPHLLANVKKRRKLTMNKNEMTNEKIERRVLFTLISIVS